MPFDLSDNSGAERPVALPVATAPTGRPSDLLRPKGAGGPGSPLGGPSNDRDPWILAERPATRFDEAASGVFWIALLVALVALGYLLWGVWSGMLAEPGFSHNYAHADRIRIIGNLGIVENVLRWSVLAALASMLFLFYDDAPAGYSLVLTAIALNLVVPWLSQFFMTMTKSSPSVATGPGSGAVVGFTSVIDFIRALAWVPAVPGILLILWDLMRRVVVGAQQAAIRRSTLRYGQNIASQARRRNVFLGRCWNLPYCRETLRTRCPVYIKRRSPCWQYKQGCMCEEHIAVLATTPDWKNAVANAMAHLEGKPVKHDGNPLLGMEAKIELSWEEKKQRCRECVIYNTHQEQKYKLAVVVVFALCGLFVFQFNPLLIGGIGAVYTKLNGMLAHFSLTTNASAVLSNNLSDSVAWFVLTFLMILVVSKLLQLVEYCCFTLKI